MNSEIVAFLDKPITNGLVLGLLMGWCLWLLIVIIACWLAELRGRWKERKDERRPPDLLRPPPFRVDIPKTGAKLARGPWGG